jgi:hypothetical protein
VFDSAWLAKQSFPYLYDSGELTVARLIRLGYVETYAETIDSMLVICILLIYQVQFHCGWAKRILPGVGKDAGHCLVFEF